ncbi:MAG: hypothetical protein ACE5MB_04295 [Anaerolineae bacterium]
MLTADAVELYELLKPKIGEEEAKALLHFVEDRTLYLVRDEIAKGLATKEDINAVKEDISAIKDDIATRLATREDLRAVKEDVMAVKEDVMAVKEDIATRLATKEDFRAVKEDVMALKEDITAVKGDIARLEKEILDLRWQTRLYLIAIGALIIITNPAVLDFLGKLLKIAP